MRISGLASGMDVDSMVKEMMVARRATYNTMVQKRMQVELQRDIYREISSKIVDFRNNKLSSYNLSNAIAAKTTTMTGNSSALTVNSTNPAATGSLEVTVDQLAKASNVVLTYDPDNDQNTKNPSSGVLLKDLGIDVSNLKVNDVSLNLVENTATLSDLAKAINSNKATKATALYNESTGQLSISNTQTGAIAVKLDGFDTDELLDLSLTNNVGLNAIINVNGINYEQDSNRFTVNGFDFTIEQKSDINGPTTLSAVQDTKKILETIKSFVSDYNNLIGEINSKLSEERYRTYLPLTDEMKSEMTDKQIELWESRAKSGLVKNDSILSKMISEFRLAATPLLGGFDTGTLDNNGKPVYQSIGISTGSYTEKGKLIINEEKLVKALETDPNKVIEMFTKRGTDTSPTSKDSGIFVKMTDSAWVALNSLSEKAGTSLTSTDLNTTFKVNALLGEQINQLKAREAAMLTRLNRIETQYYRQFTAMEKAISRFNTQSSSLFSSIG